MATVRHAFDSAKDDPVDATLIGKTKWHAPHDIEGLPYINVMDYEAAGDGVADDTDAFTAAFAVNHDVYAPAGTYKVALEHTSHQWRRLHGDGMERTILKASAGGAAISFLGGFNHGLVYSDLSIQGAATPAEKGIRAAGATTINAWFHRVQFRDLLFGFDTNGTTTETTGCHFTRCEFDNAPVRFTGAAAHNTMVFDGRCRWSGITQSVPAFMMSNSAAQDVGLVMIAPVFEGNNRQALSLNQVFQVSLLAPYFELNNLTGAADLPWVDVTSYTGGLSIADGYFTGAVGDVFVGSSASPQTSYGASFGNNNLIGGTIDYTQFPGYTLFPSVSEIHTRLASGYGMELHLGSGATSKVGFYGAAPTTKLAVTGVRDGNAGLASMLTQLGLLGLITDSTTAGTSLADGAAVKYKSGVGVTNLADGDFTVTPADGATGVAHNTTDGKSYSCARANGTWKSVEVAA